MKIVFISNFLNHHQLPICNEFLKICEFVFIATMPTANEQINLGYSDMNEQYSFVLKTYDCENNILIAKNLIINADVVIAGSCTFPFKWLRPRLNLDKLTFWFSERIYKHGNLQVVHPATFKRVFDQCTRYRNKKNYYLLCAGGYVAKDYKKMHAFPNRMLKWGYFPKTVMHDIEKIIIDKNKNEKIELLWVARFIKWKNPQIAIFLVNKLKKLGFNFHLTMLGNGVLFEKMKVLSVKLEVEKYITFTGAVPFETVRTYMDRSNIFIFTSNRKEGWGAVLNEAMNSGCAIISNQDIGGSKYLITNEVNGLTYKSKKDLYLKTVALMQDKNKIVNFGKNAYKTISDVWCAKTAVNNLMNFIEKDELKCNNEPIAKE